MSGSPDPNKVQATTTLAAAKAKVRAPAGVIMRADAATARPRQRGGRAGEPVYTRELADEICWRLASGESLIQICKSAPHMPSDTAVRFWAIEDRDGFASRYAQARRALMDRWSEDIIAIADNELLEPNDRRVRTENRRWLMSKLDHRRFGDKLIHSGDPENPIQVLHKAARIEALTPAELDALDRFVRARLTIIDAEPIEGEMPLRDSVVE